MTTATTATPETMLTELLTRRDSYAAGACVNFCPCRKWMDVTVGRRGSTGYGIEELPIGHEFGGRAFTLTKTSVGTDHEAEQYSCLISHRGPDADTCECKGYYRFYHCKHLDSLRALLANGWLDLPNPLAAAPESETYTSADVDAAFAAYSAVAGSDYSTCPACGELGMTEVFDEMTCVFCTRFFPAAFARGDGFDLVTNPDFGD